jgi:hypothetical protein
MPWWALLIATAYVLGPSALFTALNVSAYEQWTTSKWVKYFFLLTFATVLLYLFSYAFYHG